MKLFNLHILKQKTLDEELSEARRKAIAIPNKIISKLLWQIHGRKKTLKEALVESQMALREKVRNASRL